VTLLDMVELAHAGAEWERGNAAGVDQPDAQRHAHLMEIQKDELLGLVTLLSLPMNEGVANLPANAVLKLRGGVK
jgi:hypothetical protein